MEIPKWLKQDKKLDTYLQWDEYIQAVEHDDQDVQTLLWAAHAPIQVGYTLWNMTNIPTIDRNRNAFSSRSV